jgi:acyl-CoA thioesterase I
MTRRPFAVLTAVVTVVAISCGNSITSPSDLGLAPPAGGAGLTAPATWVVLGSSTAAGFAVSASQSWVSKLESAVSGSGVTVMNLAFSGAVTYHWLPSSMPAPLGRPAPLPAHNIDAAMTRRPALVLVNATTNDVADNYSVDETVANLLAVRSLAVTGGATVMMLSTQPRGFGDSERAKLPVIDARLAASFGDCFVDIRTPLAAADGRLSPSFDSGDGIHPNDRGHEVIFQRVDQALRSRRCHQASR